MNPRLKDLQFLNNMIGETIYGNIRYINGIRIMSRKHALELFEEQQRLYRKGEVLTFDQTPF